MSDRTELDLSACEREPIHIPGSIQPHGLLLVLDAISERIIQSAGLADELLGWKGPLLGETADAVLGITLRHLLRDVEAGLLSEPTYVGSLSARGDGGDLTILAQRGQHFILLELEPSLVSAPSPKRLAQIRSAADRLGSAADLLGACNLAADEVCRLTGYDRVMIYEFLPDGSGRVLAERKEERLPAFLNQRFPASDIPQQARALYLRSPIRVIPDVGYAPAPLLPPLCPATGLPLDMGHCSLRSVSPVHIQYLKNMGVGASMSVSLIVNGGLWGLIACHNSTRKLVSYEVREACRHVGQILSLQIRARDEAGAYRLAAELGGLREVALTRIRNAERSETAILDNVAVLLSIVPSHGVAVVQKGRVSTTGVTPPEAELRELAAWLLAQCSPSDLFATECLSEHFAPAVDLSTCASGLLSIVVPANEPFVVMWLRAEQVEEVRWAGNPHNPAEPGEAPGQLNPRTSFAIWKETVWGRARPWTAVEIESAQAFCTRVAFILQQHEIRELNSRLSQANVSLSLLARIDGLTGVANRRAFDERLQEEWRRIGRDGGWLALVSLDIDFFKQFNDWFGHLDGDDCLKRVADVLRSGRRAADFPSRTGGEEFSILLADTDVAGALLVAEAVRSGVETLRIDHPGSPMGIVTVSVGVAAVRPGPRREVGALLHASDQALYQAKERGRNRVESASLQESTG